MRLILNILIKYYVNKYSKLNIIKLTDEQEMKAYRFKTAYDMLDILKSNITIQTLRHFEARNEQERWMTKGAALWLQIMKDRHIQALKLESVKDEKKRVSLWKQFKDK
jgi:hypothetical protein